MKHTSAILTTLIVILLTAGASQASPALKPGAPARVVFSMAPQAQVQSGAGEPQAKALLLKLYMASARVHDLLGVAGTAQWKMRDTERSGFQQQAGAVEDQLQALEKWRYQFLYHSDDASAGGKTLDTLSALIPQVNQIAKAVESYGGAAASAQFTQPLDELSALKDQLRAYLETRFPKQFPPPAPPAAEVAPAEKPAPAAAAPAPKAASPVAAPVASAKPVEAQPGQAKAALRGVFLTDARVSDLLSLLQPAKWKMQGTERALFSERLESLTNQLKTVEARRYQFLYNIGKTDLGSGVVAALGDLIPSIQTVASGAAQYEGPAAAAGFNHAASQLTGYKQSIAAYVASLQAQYRQALEAQPAAAPGGKGLETERINAPPPTAPPVRTLVVVRPPLTPAQVKAILHNVYVSEYRVRDLLGQEHPERWKTTPAERTLAAQARAVLLTRLNELEKWRDQFSRDPGNTYNAFRTYLAINRLFHPLRVFGREAGKYESANMAGDYQRRAEDMEAQMNGLVPYIGFILQHADQNLETFQSDLVSCQSQLGYAMHGMIGRPASMKNIVPVFKGRRIHRKASMEKESTRKEIKNRAN